MVVRGHPLVTRSAWLVTATVVVGVGVLVRVAVGVGVAVATSTTATSSIDGPHVPEVVLLKVSRVTPPEARRKGARPKDFSSPLHIGSACRSCIELKFWLVDPNETVNVLSLGDPHVGCPPGRR